VSGYTTMLLEQRAKTWDQAKALLDGAAGEKRELTGEEQASYAKMTEDLNTSRAMVDKLIEDEKNATASEEALRKLADAPVNPVHAPAAGNESEALRAFLRGETRAYEINPTVAEVRAAGAYREQRAGLSGLTAAAGGATQPTNFYNQLWAHLINSSQMLQSGITVLQTNDGNQIQLPATTSHSTATWGAAQAPLNESDPAFVQRTLSAYKAGLLISVANELIEDTGVDLQGYLSMQAGRAIGNLIGQGLVVGNGTGQPTGITTLTTLGKTGSAGVAGAPNFDDMIALYYSVIPQYRAAASAAWITNDVTVGGLRTLKNTYGQYLFQPGLTEGTPDKILGKRLISEVWMPGTALNAKSVIFGDMSAYFARIVNGLRFEQSRDYQFNTDQTTFRAVLRADGTLLDQTGAVKHFVGAAS
jgi:HK97 family phage major capsid protein